VVIAKAREYATTVRIFEWLDIEPYPGHPHKLDKETLDEWLGAPGFSAHIDQSGAVGHAYYGVFAVRRES